MYRGPKFQKIIKQRQADHALKKYDPFIVQSKNFPQDFLLAWV